MPDALNSALKAAGRALELLAVLNREHTTSDLHKAARAVRHELETVHTTLSAFGNDVTTPRDGLVRNGASETSQAAARAIRTRSGSQRHQVLSALGANSLGLTDHELQACLAMNPNSERPRRLELLRAGYIEAARDHDGSPLTRARRSGLKCQVWFITAGGRAALSKLNSGQEVLFEVST